MAPRRAPSWQEPFEQGVKALGENRLDDAVAAFNIALTSAAHIAAIHQQLGVALHKQERLPAALASFRRAVELKPDSAVQCSNLGIALRDHSRFDEAASWFARACALSPDHAKNHFRWGLALMKAMRPGEALAPLRRAASLARGDSETALSLALCYLASGDFVRGWPAYEARFGHRDSIPDPFPDRRWRGETIEGTLVVGAEQGIGDMIQFIRFAGEARRRCGKLVVQAHDNLAGLLRRVEGVDAVIRRNTAPKTFDAFIPAMSLPLALGSGSNLLARTVPYITTTTPEREAAGAFLRTLGERFKVGMVWAGNPRHADDRNRSFPFELFLELAAVPDIALVSLQTGLRSGDVGRSGVAGMITDAASQLTGFVETAAIIEHLDLVVTCDTSVAHIAGAMGKPVWILLAYSADWRWMVGRAESPWYPSARLFRQSRPGDWAGVMADVVTALKEFR